LLGEIWADEELLWVDEDSLDFDKSLLFYPVFIPFESNVIL
jgi:hypothetical protein